MRRKILLFFLPLLLFLLAATPLQTVRIGIYHNPPLVFMDGDQPSGFFVDVLERIAEEEGWRLEYHLCEWEACLQALDNDEIDLLGPIAYSEERVKRFDFSGETIITNWGLVYVQSGETDISIVDLEGKKVGLLHGDIHADAFSSTTEEFSIDFEPVYFDNYADILTAIDAGRVYAGVLNYIYAIQYASQYDVEKTGIIFNPIEVRFAAPKNKNPDLLNSLDAQLAALKADKNSLYYSSMNIWEGREYAGAVFIESWVWWLVGGVLFLLLFLLSVNYVLRKEVHQQTDALRSSREELALIMDNIPSMISFIDSEQRYLYVDESYANWYGFKKEDVVGKRINEILPPETYAKVRPRLEEMLRTATEVHYSHRVMRRDGKEADLAISYIPKTDEKGKVESFFATVRDITEEKKAEIALQESEEKYRQLVDNSLVGIFIAEAEANEVKFANEGVVVLFGYDTAEEIIGLSTSSFIAPHDLTRVTREWRAKETGEKKKSRYIFKALRKDGSIFDAEIVSQMIQYHGKDAVQGMVIDISERVEAEARFRRLSEASYEAIFISERGVCLEQNSAAERLFGYTREEAVGRMGTEWIAPEDREMVMHHMLSGYEEPYRVSGLRKDGTTFSAEIRGRMMEYAGRKVRVTVLRDISDQVRAEENLRKSEESYRSIIQNNHAAMLLIEPSTGDIVEANAAASSFYGWNQKELAHKKIFEINTLSEAEIYQEMQRAETADKNHFFFKHRLANGDIRDVEVYITPLYIHEKKLLHSIIHDISSRLKAEKELLESKERFERVVARVPFPIIITAPNGDVSFYNNKFIDVFGYTLADIQLASDWWLRAYPDPEYRQRVQDAWGKAIALAEEHGQQIETQVWDMVRKDGAVRTVEFDMMPLGDISVIAMNDITERVEAEKKLRESKERFETIIAKAPIPMGIVDVAGEPDNYNERFVEVFGYQNDEVQDWWGTMCPDAAYRARAKESWEKAVELAEKSGTKLQTQTWDIVCKNGQSRTVQFDMVPLDGLSVVVMNDITDLLQITSELRDREQKLREAQEIGKMGHWELDLQTQELLWSDQVYRIFNVDPETFIPTHSAFLEAVHPEDREMAHNIYADSVENKTDYDLKIRILLENAEVRHVHDRCKTEYAEDGTPLRSIGTLQDITEEMRTEGVMNVRARLTEYSLDHSLSEILRKTLDEAEELTQSSIGFYHLVDENQDEIDISLQQWSTRTVNGYCEVENQAWHYPVDEAGVWVESIRAKAPTIHNDYASMKGRKGLPEGHTPLVRELVAPVIRADKVVAILGVGNKRTEYTQPDVEIVSLIADLCWEIAERKFTEEALQESQSFLLEAQQIARLGSYRLYINADYWSSNTVLDSIFGIDKDYDRSVAGWENLVHPDDLDMMQEYLNEDFFQKRLPFDKIYRIVQMNSQKTRWVHGMGKLEYDSEGNLESLVGTIQDITERALAEQRLQENEQRLRTLINATPDIICFKDGAGRWLTANNADLALFELSDVDYVGKTDSELAEYSDFYRDAFLTCEDSDQKAWQAGGLSRAEEVIPTKNDGDKVYDVIKVPLFKEDGTREALVVLGRDITKQIAAQAQLQHHARQLEIVNAITAALSASLSLDELLKTILHQVVQVIPCDGASIFLAKEEQQLYIVHAIGDAREFMGRSFKKDDTLMKKISPEEKVLVIDDVMNDPDYSFWDDAIRFRGWMGLSLYARGNLIGYLTFDSIKPQAFSASLASLAVAFATQIAQALYNAQIHKRIISDANDLEKRVQKRTQELQRFVDLTAGREIRMIELKEMIRELRRQLVRAGHVPVVGDLIDSE